MASTDLPLHSPLPNALSPLPNVQAILTNPNLNPLFPENDRGWGDRAPAQPFGTEWLAHAGSELPPTEWPTLSAKPRSPADAHAIAAALGCPDLFLIGGGGVPFLTDLTREAARLGRRVLVLTPRSDLTDLLLESLIPGSPYTIGRALADGETLEQLPPVAAARTDAALRQAMAAAAQQECQSAIAQATTQRHSLQELRLLLEQLTQASASHNPDLPDADTLTRNRDLIPEQVRAESVEPGESDFARTIQQARTELTQELQRLDTAIQDTSASLDEQSKELARLREEVASPHTGSGLMGRLKGLFHKPDPDTIARQEQAVQEIENTVQTLTDQLARLTAERVTLETQQQTAIELFVVAEITRRQEDIDATLLAMRTAAAKHQANIAAVTRLLTSLDFTPTYSDDPAEQTALRACVDARHEALTRELAQHQSRLQAISPDCMTIAPPSIVIGSVRSLSDPFLDADTEDSATPPFDLLIVTDAERWSDTEFAEASRLARRWIMVGDPAGSAQRGNRPLRPGLFARLWQRLYRRTWSREGQRRVARLAEVTFHDTVHTEPLADRPEIELRFTESTTGDLTLAAVLFPASISIAEAKTFLAQELDEIRLTTLGPLHWEEDAEQIRVLWPTVSEVPGSTKSAPLAHGVMEQIIETDADVLTASIAFDRAAGWNRDSASEWVEQHTRLARSARTALADRPQSVPSYSS
ncbi:MAG: hypothetical protein LC104_09155 [Bacteroidales bacterium]|nr:hypothetical protein [Bacteroidales bacterium]